MRQEVQYVGPFDRTVVVMDGREVPFLEASHLGDRVSLTLDSRFGLNLTVAEAERVVPFLADAIAVGLGYTCHPRHDEEPRRRTLFPRLTEITSVQSQTTESKSTSQED